MAVDRRLPSHLSNFDLNHGHDRPGDNGTEGARLPLLFEDQFEKLPPRVFPAELDRHTIPPISKQLVAQTVTPLYVLGWPITKSEFIDRYQPSEGSSKGFSDVRIDLGAQWAKHWRNTVYDDYTDFAPEILSRDVEDNYIIAILGNYNAKYLRKSLDDDFVESGASFLRMEGSPKWFRV